MIFARRAGRRMRRGAGGTPAGIDHEGAPWKSV
jgi:hypothetical protein